jgi:preprotein translocase subunit SecD
MLMHSRWQTAAILGVTAFFCLAAVPNVLPARALAALPSWAQRTVPLGYDLQGGTYVQFEVDAQDRRRLWLETLRSDVRRTLRAAQIAHSGVTIRGDTVEVRLRDASNLTRAREHLGVLVRAADLVAEGELIRLSLDAAWLGERITRSRNGMVERWSRQLNFLGTGSFSVRPVGSDRLVVELPGITHPAQLFWHHF